MNGKLIVVGFGPGNSDHITQRAKETIAECDYIIGYNTYVDLIREYITTQEIVSTGMSEEVSRAQAAVDLAEKGKKVAVISSGDAGVYGMAGLIYEVLIEKGWDPHTGVDVEMVPGISAINSCASLLGAPIMHDACTISLSDHLTPWKLIEDRLEAAAKADFVIALYNPKSGKRTRQIEEAQSILLQYRSPETPVGLVKSAYRDRQNVVTTTLKDMLSHDIGMLTTVIIGNSSTFLYKTKMITPRGYQRKYTLNAVEQKLKPHERLRKENEPWALHQGKEEKTSLEIALEASKKLDQHNGLAFTKTDVTVVTNPIETIFELAVSPGPGVATKKFTPEQLLILADIVGEGTMEITPHQQIVLRIPTSNPKAVTTRLEKVDLVISPVGDVLQVKACDFCDGEKKDAIVYAEQLQQKLAGIDLPKELKLGVNGCGMACYGAVKEDIGIIYRQGKFDLFLGAKPVGRTAHSGQLAAEGIAPEDIVELIEQIIFEYKEKGHPNERFFKYFKRIGKIQDFTYQDITPNLAIEPALCGD